MPFDPQALPTQPLNLIFANITGPPTVWTTLKQRTSRCNQPLGEGDVSRD